MFDYWVKQATDKPLFPDFEWDRPERKDQAGKLLIIGGSTGSFKGAAEAYSIANDAGIGEVKALIPESLRKITKDLPDISYAPSNSSGSFSVQSAEIMTYASLWADGVILSGEYGRNSETSISLSSLVKSYGGFLFITKDGVDILHSEFKNIAQRNNVFIICSYSQLQKIAIDLKDEVPFKYSDPLTKVVEHLHEFTINNKFNIITKHADYLIASTNGQIITTERKDLDELWCLRIATILAVNTIQKCKEIQQALANSLLK